MHQPITRSYSTVESYKLPGNAHARTELNKSQRVVNFLDTIQPSLSFFPPLIFLFLFTLFATPNESKTLFWKKSPRCITILRKKERKTIRSKSSSHRNEFNRKIDDDHTYDRTRSNNISHPPSVLGRVTFPWKLSHNFLEVVYVYISVYTHTYIQRFLPVHVYCRER